MKRFCSSIVLVFLLNTIGFAEAEIVCTKINHLSDLEQRVFHHSLEQAEQWDENFDVYQEVDEMFDEGFIEAISDIHVNEPTVVYFLKPHSEIIEKMDPELQVSVFLNQTILSNSLVQPLQGAFLDALSTYSIYSDEMFSGVYYVVFYYTEELPVMVTSICEVTEGQALTKTGLVYAHGQYENEFFAFAGSLLTRFGTESFDISYYKIPD